MSQLHPAMKTTRAEKLARAEDKRRLVMNFLASGEVYSTVSVLAGVMGVREQTAQPLLKRMVEEKLLRVDKNAVPFSNLKLWGITAHGLAIAESSHEKCTEFCVGKTSAGFVEHHLDGQRVRLDLERNGWTNYVPGKILMQENELRKGKCIPDALATRPDGCRVAIEIERHVKSRTRLGQVIAGHLQQIDKKQYEYVFYFTPHRVALARAFLSVPAIKVGDRWEILSDAHRSKIKIMDMDFFGKKIPSAGAIFDHTL